MTTACSPTVETFRSGTMHLYVNSLEESATAIKADLDELSATLLAEPTTDEQGVLTMEIEFQTK